MDIKIGDKVRLKREFNSEITPKGMELTVKDMNDARQCSFEELKPLKKWKGVGIEGKYVETEYFVPTSCLELVKPKRPKTNIIKRLGNSGTSVITHDIIGKEIEFNVKGKIHITTLLKILLHETKLYNYKYDRVSPFKISRKYIKEDTQHKWWIDFIDIRSYENVHQELIKCDNCMRFEGDCKIFIADLLELCIERNLIQRFGNGYKLIKNLDNAMEYCEYENIKPSVRILEKEGYMIPDKYKNYNK